MRKEFLVESSAASLLSETPGTLGTRAPHPYWAFTLALYPALLHTYATFFFCLLSDECLLELELEYLLELELELDLELELKLRPRLLLIFLSDGCFSKSKKSP